MSIQDWEPEDILLALVMTFGVVVLVLALTGVIDDKASCSVSITSVTTTEVPHG